MNLDSVPSFSLEPAGTAATRWEFWISRLENFLLAHGIADEGRKKAILLHCVGEEVFERYRAIDLLDGAGTYNDTKVLLDGHFAAKRNAEYEVFNFRRTHQNPGESIDSFYTRLKQASKHCEFADAQKEIRSQIIQQTAEAAVRDKGLREPTWTLDQLLDYGRGLEAARLQSGNMVSQPLTPKHVPAVGTVNQFSKTSKQTPKKKQTFDRKKGDCRGCGGTCTDRKRCRAWGKACNKCKKLNHFAAVCNAPTTFRVDSTSSVQSSTATSNSTGNQPAQPLYNVNAVEPVAPQPYWVSVSIFGQTVKLQVDTGSCSTLLCVKDFRKLFPNKSLDSRGLPMLFTYSKEPLKPIGRMQADVVHEGTTFSLPVLVVPGDGPNLLGRDWLAKIRLNWREVFSCDVTTGSVQEIASEFPELFSPGLGKLEGVEVKFDVDMSVTPKCIKARTVPYAFREKVEDELDRLVAEGTLVPVAFSEWATPIVPVLKRNGSVRICGDYKQTANLAIKVDKYPLPHADDLFAKLAGSSHYAKLDLSHAYSQLVLAAESRPLTTISTSKGLFAYTRLPFGISSAPALFQRIMEQLLQGIQKTAVYLDDILVGGGSKQEHKELVTRVLQKLSDAGLRLEKSKCTLGADSVTYLGYIIDASGVHPTGEKVEAIRDAPAPRNVNELRSFLGLVNFYHKFLPNMSSVLAPLNELLRKDSKWSWSKPQVKAFAEIKSLLQSSKVLVHYNPKLPITMSADASPYGVGAVLSHIMPDGSEKPIAYASRSLSTAERNYAQIDREALGLVFGVHKFHRYVFGRRFRIHTDHKPLLGLLQSGRAIPQMASGRMLRWALFLANYNYSLEYRTGPENGNADALSRLPLDNPHDDLPVPEEVVLSLTMAEDAVLSLRQGDDKPVTARTIGLLTQRDPVLSQVLRMVREGWPSTVEPALQPYHQRQTELSLFDGCICWGSRVIVPSAAREAILAELHTGHAGMVRMKALGRCFVWWPGCDADIEGMVKNCSSCCKEQRRPTPATLHPWEWPGKPWVRLNIDYAGPIGGKYILVIVDAHSKFIVSHVVDSQTAHITIRKLRETFAMCGLPQIIVSDNASIFTCQEFHEFCYQNGIKHIRSSPFHPSSNGAAERGVQTVKNGVRKMADGDLHTRVSRFLLSYNTTPQSTTGVSPGELLMKRQLRTRLCLVLPDVESKVLTHQAKEIESHQGRPCSFSIGDPVFCRNYAGSPYWVPGTLEERLGPLTFTARLTDGRVWKRHADQLLSRRPEELLREPSSFNQEQAGHAPSVTALPTAPAAGNLPSSPPASDSTERSASSPEEHAEPVVSVPCPAPPETPSVRRSARARQPPPWQRLGEFEL